MARRFQRVRTRLTATVQVAGSQNLLVCPTRDISAQGCFLDTGEPIPIETHLIIAVMDNARGEVVEARGVVARRVADGIGVVIEQPPPEWTILVERCQAESGPVGGRQGVRLQVLVIGDTQRRRSALALYVTSGWDVRFASDLATTVEALGGAELAAVIVEHELDDERWPALLLESRRIQPAARRIIRCPLRGQAPPATKPGVDLVDHVVDLDAGLDALLDAITADFPIRAEA